MREHRYKNVSGVLVDECYSCGGFFLDPGELQSIRNALGERLAREQRVASLIENDPVWQDYQVDLENEREVTANARSLNAFLMQRVFPFKWPI